MVQYYAHVTCAPIYLSEPSPLPGCQITTHTYSLDSHMYIHMMYRLSLLTPPDRMLREAKEVEEEYEPATLGQASGSKGVRKK